MAQFDVYRNGNPQSRRAVPFLLDVQADLLDDLATRVVVPLRRVTADQRTLEGLTPRLSVAGGDVCMSTPELAGVPKAVLGERVTSLRAQRDTIVGALDLLLTGV